MQTEKKHKQKNNWDIMFLALKIVEIQSFNLYFSKCKSMKCELVERSIFILQMKKHGSRNKFNEGKSLAEQQNQDLNYSQA